ncbi:MAG: hypothetical protein NC133_04435, partial [Prevotella sp.]|nr:hypothetical protein [Prevotella sp.]
MGNKRKAALATLLSVLLVAVAGGVGALFFSFDHKNTAVYAAETYIEKSGSDYQCQTKLSTSVDYGAVYCVQFAGQDGAYPSDGNKSNAPGNGAICLAYYKATSSTINDWVIGTYDAGHWFDDDRGSNGRGGAGGGATTINANFAMPNGYRASTAIAAGGGGSGSSKDKDRDTRWGGDGGDAGWYVGEDGETRREKNKNGNYSNGYGGLGGRSPEKDGKGSWPNDAAGRGGLGDAPGSNGRDDDARGGLHHHYRTYGGGGGGASSLNCYPYYGYDCSNGSTSTGYGYIKMWRVDPTIYPTGSRVKSGSTATITAPSSINNHSPLNANRAWIYRAYQNGAWTAWTTNPSTITNDTTNSSLQVQCRCVLYANGSTTTDSNGKYPMCYNMKYTSATAVGTDDNYTLAQTTIYLVVGTVSSVDTKPTGKSLTFNNDNQQLLSDGGSGSHGTMKYKLGSNGSWTTDWRSLTAKEVGTYTIYCYVVTDSDIGTDSKETSVTATISKATTSLSAKGLSARRLIYNGNQLQLFEGNGSCTAPAGRGGDIYYGWAYSDKATASEIEANADSKSISTLKATNAYSDGGVQFKYYLYYRMTESDSYQAIGWTYTNVSTVIDKATFSISCAINPAATYDGLYHNLYDNAPVISADSGAPTSMIVTTYQRHYTAYNGIVIDSDVTEDLSTLQTARDAGHYTIDVTMTPKTNYRNQINPSTAVLTPYDIKKSSDRYIATLSGLDFDNSESFELDETASVQPFLPFVPDGETFTLDLTVGGVAQYNGLSTNNPSNYNQVGYLLTQSIDLPDDNTLNEVDYFTPEDQRTRGFIPLSPDELNEAITNITVHASKGWFLWLKIVQHSSLNDDVLILAAQFSCKGMNDAKVILTGLTLTGADNPDEDGSIVYDGLYHPIVKLGAGIEAAPSQKALEFVDVEYAVSTNSNHAAILDLAWYSSLDPRVLEAYQEAVFDDESDPFQQKNVNKYYLWVRWGESANLQGTSGIIYGHMEITQLQVQTNANFHVDGINFTWENHVTDSGWEVYSAPFNNADQTIGTFDAQSDIRTCNAAGTDLSVDLIGYGDLAFGLSTELTEMNGVYYGWDEFSQVVVHSVGTYYLWMSWPGSVNVSAGDMVYRFKADGTLMTPYFVVEQLVDNTSMELDYAVKNINNIKEHDYAWQFVYDADSTTDDQKGRYEGVAQALFTTDVTPSISIGGFLYSAPSVTYRYMLSADGENVTPATDNTAEIPNSGWVNSLDQAVMTDVNTYYLWVLVMVDDDDVAISKTFRVDQGNENINGCAKIVTTESFVLINPRAAAQVHNNLRQNVFKQSGQGAPLLEYALFRMTLDTNNNYIEEPLVLSEAEATDDTENFGVYVDEIKGWKWSSNIGANMLRPIDAGLYKIYYRGAAYEDKFFTQRESSGGYPYILVEITPVGVNIEIAPTTSDIVYRGTYFTPSELFTEGFAKTANYVPADKSETGKQVGKNHISLLYSWDNKNWTIYENLEPKINAGFYALYYKPDATQDDDLSNDEADKQVATLAIQIRKANIALRGPNLTGETLLPYKAANYHLFDRAINYEMVDANNVPLQDASGKTLSYDDGDHDPDELNPKNLTMGEIYYAVTMGARVYPTANDWT